MNNCWRMRGCAEAGLRRVFSEILGILGYTNTVFVCFHTYGVYIPYKIMIHSVGIITDLIVFVCLFVLADWERGIDSHGRVYYIDHINRTTTWVRPRRSKQSTSTRPSPNQRSTLTYYLHIRGGVGRFPEFHTDPSFFFFFSYHNPTVDCYSFLLPKCNTSAWL